MIVEKDVQIPMRDGTILYADVFRPDAGDERFPAIMNMSVYQKDKLWVPPADLEEEANPHMNWETVNPLWWVPRGLCLRARGLARHREIARQVGAQLVPGRRGFLRCDRVDRQTALVLRQHRPLGHLLSCELAMAGCQSPASVAQGDHSLGGTRRPVPRSGLSRRHLCPGLHRQLVADPYGAPSARPAAQL